MKWVAVNKRILECKQLIYIMKYDIFNLIIIIKNNGIVEIVLKSREKKFVTCTF